MNSLQHDKSGSKEVPIVIGEAVSKSDLNQCYPGVQIVGSNEFRRRCSELSKRTDSTYNKLMSLQKPVNCMQANQVKLKHVELEEKQLDLRTVKMIIQDRQKHNFVNWLMTRQGPPLQQNRRFPVTREEIIHYSAMVELALNPSHRKELGIQDPKVHCNYQSLGESLMPCGEVDNFLIPCFCRMFFHERHPASSGRHYFFPHIGEGILKYCGENEENLVRTSFVGAAKASRGRNIAKFDRLFFPIVNSHHWFVFAVDLEHKIFAFLDSFHDKKSAFYARVQDRLINNFIHLWELIVSKEHNFDSFRVMYPHVPKQQNSVFSVSAGVYAVKSMEIWVPYIDLRTKFSHNDIINIRIQYANKLYFSSQNSVDKSLVTDFYDAA